MPENEQRRPMQLLNLISENVSAILFALAVAAFVFNALTAIVGGRQTREYPPGIRVLWGAASAGVTRSRGSPS